MKKFTLIILILILTIIPTISSAIYETELWPPVISHPGFTYQNIYVFYDKSHNMLNLWEMDGLLIYRRSDGWLIHNYAHKRWLYDGNSWELYEEHEAGQLRGIPPDYIDYLVFANRDIPYDDGFGFWHRRTDLDFLADVNIVTPPSGVHDTLSEMIFTINTEFNKLLTPDEIKSIDYKFYINGEKKNILKKLNEAFLPLSVKDRTSHILSFEIIVPIGENFCEIIYYNDEGIEIGYGSVEFERLAGFIDADGDGKDDRTGRTSGIRRSSDDIDSTIDKPEKPGDDANAIDWLKYLGEYVGYIFEVLLNSISNFAKNVVSGVGSVLSLAEPMFSFISQFFSSMPVEIRTGFIAMFSVSAFLVIMKMIRG